MSIEELKNPAPAENAVENVEESEASETLDAKADGNEKENQSEESEDSKDESDETKPKPQSGFKKRIDKLNKKLSAEAQEKEYWKAEALKKHGQQEPQQKDADTKPLAKAEGKPDARLFDSHEEYIDALTDWKIEQREQQKEQKAKEIHVKSEHQKKAEAFTAKLEEFKKTVDDFDDLVDESNDVPGNIGISESIFASEVGPELIYELAKNKEEYKRIAKLDPLSAAREVGRLEARLLNKQDSSKEKEIKKQTKTPPPIAPLGSKGSGSIKKSIYDENTSFKDFEKMRRAGAN